LKFGVSYHRRVKAGKTYEMLEIGLYAEFVTSQTSYDEAFKQIRDKVNVWIEEERDRILAECVPRPESKDSSTS